MPAFLIPWLIRGALALGAMLVVYGAYHAATEHYRQQGRAEVQAKWDADKAARIKALTDMTLLWDAKRQAAEKTQEALDHERQTQIDRAQARVKTLDATIASIRFPASALRLSNDAIRDSAATAGPSGTPDATTPAAAGDSNDSTVGLVTQWAVTVIGLYNTCRDTVTGWNSFYSSLQAAQPPEVSP